MIGSIVCSTAGRDKGKFMVIVGIDKDLILVADGKERSLEKPKKKNPKHLKKTNSILENKQYSTNKLLRKALNEFRKAYTSQEED